MRTGFSLAYGVNKLLVPDREPIIRREPGIIAGWVGLSSKEAAQDTSTSGT